jgi:hypothetical protein
VSTLLDTLGSLLETERIKKEREREEKQLLNPHILSTACPKFNLTGLHCHGPSSTITITQSKWNENLHSSLCSAANQWSDNGQLVISLFHLFHLHNEQVGKDCLYNFPALSLELCKMSTVSREPCLPTYPKWNITPPGKLISGDGYRKFVGWFWVSQTNSHVPL